MSSFYGGNPGTPFVIAKTYTSIDALKEDFLDNINCLVNFGEYAIVSHTSVTEDGTITKDSNNTENGFLFRREYDGSATFVGDIQGPVGGNLHELLTKVAIVSGDTITIDSDTKTYEKEYADTVEYHTDANAYDLYLGYKDSGIKIPYVTLNVPEDGVTTVDPNNNASVTITPSETNISASMSFRIPRGASINGITASNLNTAERKLIFSFDKDNIEDISIDYPAIQNISIYQKIDSLDEMPDPALSETDTTKFYVLADDDSGKAILYGYLTNNEGKIEKTAICTLGDVNGDAIEHYTGDTNNFKNTTAYSGAKNGTVFLHIETA